MPRNQLDRVAALYDIHGNLPALEAVLEDLADERPDAVVIGGDAVLGPMPGEVLERLLALGPPAHFIRGNCDRLVVEGFDGGVLDGLPPPVRETVAWTASRIDRRQRDLLSGLPLTLTLPVAGLGEVLFCHATPRSDEEIFTQVTPGERVRPMLAAVRQGVVVCGHTHVSFDRELDEIRIVNAGSVGMPFGSARAHWLLLGPDVRRTATDYVVEAAAERIRATSYPRPAEFLDRMTAWEALSHFDSLSPAETASALLASLYEEDRREHGSVPTVGTPAYRDLRDRDRVRRERAAEALEVLEEEGRPSPDDLYRAAWLFNHGDEPAEARQAHELALRAAEGGHPEARWLAAAAYDRWCMYEGRPQRFGTQFVPDGTRYRLWDWDAGTTDRERAAWDVPPLAEQLRRAERMTREEPQPPIDDAPPWLEAALQRWRKGGAVE